MSTGVLATRGQYVDLYAGTTKADIAFALELARTPDEVDAAAHLSLVLFNVAGCRTGFTEHGIEWPALTVLVGKARARVHGFDPSYYRRAEVAAAASEEATRKGKAQRKQSWNEREERIRRLGFTNATRR